jgi:hypothetical protein
MKKMCRPRVRHLLLCVVRYLLLCVVRYLPSLKKLLLPIEAFASYSDCSINQMFSLCERLAKERVARFPTYGQNHILPIGPVHGYGHGRVQ